MNKLKEISKELSKINYEPLLFEDYGVNLLPDYLCNDCLDCVENGEYGNLFSEIVMIMNCDKNYQDYQLMLFIADVLGLDVHTKDESGNIIRHDRDMKLKSYYQTTGILFLEVYDED